MKKLSSLLIILLITGCSYVQTVKNWWEPTPPAAQMMPSKIKIGYVPVLVSAPLFVAQEEGWIAAEKLDVELVRYGSGAQLNQGVLAGDVDVVIAPITTSLVAKSSGVEFPAVAALGEQQMVFVARGEFATLFKNKNFKQAAEELQHLALRKPKIGTFLRGGITDIVTRKWLAQTQGMSEDDVEIIYFNVDQMEQAFMAGNIDAAIVWEPMRQILNQKAQGIYIIAQGEELYPRQAGVVMMVSRNMIQKHPEKVEKLVAVNHRAVNFIKENPQKAAVDSHKYVATGLLSAAAIEQLVTASTGAFFDNPRDLFASTEILQQDMVNYGTLSAKVDLKGVINTSFYDRVINPAVARKN